MTRLNYVVKYRAANHIARYEVALMCFSNIFGREIKQLIIVVDITTLK